MGKIFRTIRLKLLSILGVVALSWVVFGILAISSHNNLRSLHRLQHQMSEFGNALTALAESVGMLNSTAALSPGALQEKSPNSVVTPYKSAYGNLTQLTSSLSEYDFFRLNPAHEEILVNSTEMLEKINEEYQATLTLLLERGTDESGLIGEWNQTAENLNNSSYAMDNPMVSTAVDELLTLKQSYQNSLNASLINEITIKSEQLKSQIETDTSFLSLPPGTISDFTSAINAFNVAANQVLDKDIRIGFTAEAGMVSSVNTKLESVQNEFKELNQRINSKAEKTSKRTNTLLWIFWIVFTLLAVGSLFWISRHLNTTLQRLREFVRKIANGMLPDKLQLNQQDEFQDLANQMNEFLGHLQSKIDFADHLASGKTDMEFKPIGEHDSLGNALLSLQKNLQQTKEDEAKNQIENEKRRWTNEGLARFAEILRQNNNNMEELASNLIINLVKYVNATQGGIFLVNDDDKEHPTIELKAAVAYDRRKYIKKTLEMGEGLVGTVAVEKKSILLTEIPQNYLEITSGLGDAEPKCLLIVPLNLENEVLGVVELASFNVFDTHEVEFIERIGESIASTLTTVRVNEKTSLLLSQSQRQAAEMAEQEEEMRQNMEELQATQEEASRRETEITSIINAINSTSLVVEYDMGGHIININERFLKLLEAPKADVLRMHHSDFTSKVRTENTYIEFWNTLMEGKPVNNTEVIKLLNGKKLWLNQSYTPILNQDGKPSKVLNIAIDITETKTKEQNLEKRSRDMQKKTNEINTLNTAINQSIIKCEYTPDGTVVDANENYAAMMGYPLEEIIGKNVRRFLSQEEQHAMDAFWPNLVDRKPHKTNLKRIKPGGDEHWLVSTFTPVVDENNNVYKIFYLAQDITEQRMKYDLLVEANKEIERLKSIMDEEGLNYTEDDNE